MIELEYVYDKAYALRAYMEVSKSRNRVLIPAYWFFLLFYLVVMVFVTLGNYQQRDGFDTGYFILMGILAWLLLVPFYIRGRVYSNFKKSPLGGATVRWAIDETGLRNTAGNSEGKFAWPDVYQVLERRKGFLIFSQPNFAALLPAEAFASEVDKEKLRACARAAGKLKA